MNEKKRTVVVLGASSKQNRYSNRAIRSLLKEGYKVFPVNPKESSIEGLPVFASLTDITDPVETVSVYLSPEHLEKELPRLLELKPKRVILNPGTANYAIIQTLSDSDITVIEDCTLILLSSGEFLS